MSLQQEIATWDGKSAADIRAVYAAHHTAEDFVDTLVNLAFTPACERGATWLLKAWLEAGNTLNQYQVRKVYGSTSQLGHWEARLHILQSIPFIPIAESECDSVYHFLKHTLTDQNKFVRAWSYNGFYELSRQHSRYLSETRQYFDIAMRDEAPSVKARLRNIVKKGF